MTSSLVGSEMCIRDSLGPVPCDRRPRHSSGNSHACLELRHSVRGSSRGCLLYTSDAADDM
eukprot:9032243-Prorocentrum_lima.AAC.1